MQPEADIAPLKHERYFIDDFHGNRIRVTALHTYIHRIFIPIGKTGGTTAEGLDSASAVKHIPIRQYHQAQDKQSPLPDGKERDKSISGTRQKDNQNQDNIETAV
ncbi:hypothetical protein HMPREF9446_01779 [Bacteroides fluxus YIT 12057]|uniref:Uncharacterized protein n=1 Tax=Bacteroides fluxus YIT 12057 TaxID=763034 RepID=F3PSR7_9BACE|nr:hypothetical protein HMPREF9446_01779 [Bacteroides fluxus YIT 12057]